MNVAIIPARAGSRRIPRKNIRLFYGKPIIAYSIEAAKQSGLFDAIYVSTDDREMMELASDLGCYIHIRSRASMYGDVVGTQEVARDCLLNIEPGYEYAACIYATAPLMTGADLHLCYHDVIQRGLDYSYIEGWCYVGRTEAFLQERPLIGPKVMKVEVPDRWVDINVEADWQRAKKLYAKWNREGVTA